MYGVLLLFLILVQRIMRAFSQCIKPMLYEMLMRYRALRDVVTMTEVVSIVHHLGGGIGIRQICVWRNYQIIDDRVPFVDWSPRISKDQKEDEISKRCQTSSAEWKGGK
jgi:hypothetical protein